MRQRESLARRATSSVWRIWRCVCILVSLLVLADGLSIDSEKLLVNTKWGFLRGTWSTTARNRSVANFLGIPYALPPVGDLRFKSPQRWNRMWTTIRNATADGQMCVQYNPRAAKVIGSENCLYLNIFVPQPISDDRPRPAKLPVLVFVHGGGFKSGNSDSKLYGPDYLMDQDIILVTLNYRLSALGFFSTTNQVSPGNYAIKDVKMALEWVQENIQSFGGNPDSVTLMGHSAGSAVTHILALSKKTEGLFHRYVLQSGSATSPWSFRPQRRYRQTCLKLAKLVGCLPEKDDDVNATNETTTNNPINNPETGDDISNQDFKVRDDEEIMKCMRTVDARRLEEMTNYFTVWRSHPWFIFGPTLEDESEDAILTMHPLKIVKEGLFRDIPVIIQIVKDEGLVKTLELLAHPDAEDELIENFEEYLPYFMEYHEIVSNTSVFASAIQDFYFSGNVSLGLAHNITKMVSDSLIIWQMFQTVQYQSKLGNSSIYFSFFAYEGTFSHTFSMGNPMYYGVAHGDDLNYIFPILNNVFSDLLLHNTENDITMINIITEMWASFVTNGIPEAWMIPAWPNYRDNHEIMRFGIERLPKVVVQADFRFDRMEFWEKLMINQSAESANNDVFVSEPPKNIFSSNANAIDRRLTVQFALLAIIFAYM